MTAHCAHDVRTWIIRIALALAILALCAGISRGQADSAVVRVEEDWELVIGMPDFNSDAPQVTCVISPLGDVRTLHAAFDLNHQSQPWYAPGGLQLQVWNGELPLGQRAFPVPTVMAYPGEVVSWTQTMEVADGLLVFEVINGHSLTWGPFGKEAYLLAAVPSELSSLDLYDPAVSVRNSGVGYARNRVELLVLKRVRLHFANGDKLEDNTPRVVHALAD